MSFGGAVSAMITSLKNNSRRKSKSHFETNNIGNRTRDTKLDSLLKKEATKEQLEKIRKKIKRQKINKSIKIIIAFIVFTIVAYYTYNYFSSISNIEYYNRRN